MPSIIRCEPIEEVLAEKTGAMSERGLPRDLYDIIHVHHDEGVHLDGLQVCGIVEEKCAHRYLPLPIITQIEGSPRRRLPPFLRSVPCWTIHSCMVITTAVGSEEQP